jgi:hypothetical protein
VCMLLGDGGLLLCSGGVFFGVRSGGDIFDIYYCCYAVGVFSLGSVLGPLLGNDIYIKSSLFFGVCSGVLIGNDNRQVVFSLWSCCWAAAQLQIIFIFI